MLEPFKPATQKKSGEEYVTISLIIPLIKGTSFSLSKLETTLTSLTAQNILEQLKQSIAKRIKPYEQRTPTILASILDPRFKKKGSKTEEESQRAAQMLQEYTAHLNAWKATQALLTKEDTPAQPAASHPSTSKFETEQNKKIDALLNFLEKPYPTSVSTTTDAIIDTRQFLEKPIDVTMSNRILDTIL
ncbi:hypothetical protein JTB14_022474 [Gonioctena quinquepunctata]|nr:hypothetical protein JTB14_022474 [Gonioctena quinquepunctata]